MGCRAYISNVTDSNQPVDLISRGQGLQGHTSARCSWHVCIGRWGDEDEVNM